MKNLHPYGIPHSIFFENLFAKTYDAAKLEEDGERIRQAYTDHGYFQAKVARTDGEHRSARRQGLAAAHHQDGIARHLRRYRAAGGRGPPVSPACHEIRWREAFPDARRADAASIRHGTGRRLLRPTSCARASRTCANSTASSDISISCPSRSFDFIPNTDQVDLTITADEGKQFFVRRIDFSGNTTTRDKVIRREILLDEGDMFNSSLWDLSILRLNQLGYFEVLKKEDAADIHKNIGSNTVDITLKVKERGKNSIGLNGGVSGIAGSFVGFNYSTNNFLGLGETLSLGIAARHPSCATSRLGFTEPYLLDQPIQTGLHGLSEPLRFQPGPRSIDSGGAEPDSAV